MVSAPASSAATNPSTMPMVAETAAISSASVSTVPVNPSSSRSTPVVICLLIVANSRSSAGTSRCPVITARQPASIAARNGRYSACGQLVPVPVQGGHLVVRVGAGGTVPREVLGAGRHPGALDAPDRGRDLPGRHHRVGAERPHPDHRVGRIEVHVGHRGQVQRHAGPGQPGADAGIDRLGGGRIVQPAQRGRTRRRAAPDGVQPGDVAALLVQAEHQVATGRCPQPLGQPGHRTAVAEVGAEQDHPAEPVGQPAQQPVRWGSPHETRHETGQRQPADLGFGTHDHPSQLAANGIDNLRWTILAG